MLYTIINKTFSTPPPALPQKGHPAPMFGLSIKSHISSVLEHSNFYLIRPQLCHWLIYIYQMHYKQYGSLAAWQLFGQRQWASVSYLINSQSVLHLSTTKSPQQIMGSLVKNHFGASLGKRYDLWCVTFYVNVYNQILNNSIYNMDIVFHFFFCCYVFTPQMK